MPPKTVVGHWKYPQVSRRPRTQRDEDRGGETDGGASLTDDGSCHIRNGGDLVRACVSSTIGAPGANTWASTYQAAHKDPVVQPQACRSDEAGSKAQHHQGDGDAHHGGADSPGHRPLIVVHIVGRQVVQVRERVHCSACASAARVLMQRLRPRPETINVVLVNPVSRSQTALRVSMRRTKKGRVWFLLRRRKLF